MRKARPYPGKICYIRQMKNEADLINVPDDCHARCRAVCAVLDRIGDKWVVMVVGTLSMGPIRFNALKRLIGGVSQRMLTLTLRGMERDGLVSRTHYSTIPPRVEYTLTDLGHSLIAPLEVLSAWADFNLPAIEAARQLHNSRKEEEMEVV